MIWNTFQAPFMDHPLEGIVWILVSDTGILEGLDKALFGKPCS